MTQRKRRDDKDAKKLKDDSRIIEMGKGREYPEIADCNEFNGLLNSSELGQIYPYYEYFKINVIFL